MLNVVCGVGAPLRMPSGRSRDADQVAFADDDGALDDVLELADVAGPRVAHQQPPRLGLEGLDLAIVLLGAADAEVLGEQRDVVRTLAQRRHRQRDGVDAEVEIAAQRAVRQRQVEIDVGGAHQPEVRGDGAGAADRPELALLQDAQQLGLQRRLHLADLVEEQRAAVRELDQADLVGDGAR